MQGTLRIANGAKTLNAGADTAGNVTRGIPHAWCSLMDGEARMWVSVLPGHLEGLFKRTVELKSHDEAAAVADQYDCLIVGRPLLPGLIIFKSPHS